MISAVLNPSEDRKAVETWFANHTGGGKSLVGRMAAFYIVLSDADVSKKPQKKVMNQQDKKKQKPLAKPTVKVEQVLKETKPQKPDVQGVFIPPSVNINLEIHISSDATSDQIDKIFESMSKHIYQK